MHPSPFPKGSRYSLDRILKAGVVSEQKRTPRFGFFVEGTNLAKQSTQSMIRTPRNRRVTGWRVFGVSGGSVV
jgi:hypothetical protein